MSASAILAHGAVSPLGRGRAAFAVPAVGEGARFVGGPIEAFASRGVRLPNAAIIDVLPGSVAQRSAGPVLAAAVTDCVQMLDVVRPLWRSERIGLALGTSSGGMIEAEALFAAIVRGEACADEMTRSATYGAPFLATAQSLGVRLTRGASVLVACASSTIAIGLGHTWLENDVCDVVLAGGYDVLSLFVAAGFSSLAAISPTAPRPFRLHRDGLALSEGAGMIALVRASEAPGPCIYVTGFGVSSDATHITAPDRTGSGLVAAASGALRRANVEAAHVDLVSAHGTATPFNDAAEARALRTLGVDLERLTVHAAKGAFGHALGAAGVLETLAIVDAIERSILPASAGGDDAHPLDPDASVPLRDISRAGEVHRALKLSAAFGGVNAALVLTDTPPPESPARAAGALVWSDPFVVLQIPSRESLATLTGASVDRLARLDDLAALVLGAILAATRERSPAWLADKALIVQTGYATIARNERYFRRILDRNAAAAEPRRFPGTSPNLAAGEASIVLGMRGPVLTLGGDPSLAGQANAVAEDLLRAGHADAAVVVHVEEACLAATRIALALGRPPPESGATARVVERLAAR